jgi:hypothetical protein
MLTTEMQQLIVNHTAGMVATINSDGTPSVSPKATFVVVDDANLAFGYIRSPGTLANLRHRPDIEVCCIDVLTRKAVRISGQGALIKRADAAAHLLKAFEPAWSDYASSMSAFVHIAVTKAEMILSLAYDQGQTEAELHTANLARLNVL